MYIKQLIAALTALNLLALICIRRTIDGEIRFSHMGIKH